MKATVPDVPLPDVRLPDVPLPDTPAGPLASGMPLGQAYRQVRGRFVAACLPTPGLDARILTLHALGLDRLALVTRPQQPIGARASQLELAVLRRLRHEPVARILGAWEFYGLALAIGTTSLVPRPDSETLVDAVLERVDRKAALRLLDLGTGSGALLIACLTALPNATGIGVDLDAATAAVARSNVVAHGLGSRASVMVGHWSAALAAGFDVVIANPPYIPTAEIDALDDEVRWHDPRLALDGGVDGLTAHRAIAQDLARLIVAKDGLAVIEIGDGQADAAQKVYAAAGFRGSTQADVAGRSRALALRRITA